MITPAFSYVLSREKFDAVLFDLDGVITATDKVHYAAWKKLFDAYLHQRAKRDGVPFHPFEHDDMLAHVDGKPRYEGVRSFLESRDIELPYGAVSDPEDAETVCGLGNRKNRLFNEALEEVGVEIFDSSVTLVKALSEKGVRCAVVSSSKNTRTVLRTARLTDLFDVCFDGIAAADLGLVGKPTPDTYLKAAELIGVEPARAVVVEDAVSGVQAGRAGNFGLVIGVDRGNNAEALRKGGADIVIRDLAELSP